MIIRVLSASRILRFCSAGKKPGQSALTPHAVRREFTSDVLSQVDHGGFRCRVGEHSRQRNVRRHAPDIQDRSAAARFDHLTAEDLTGLVNALEIRLDDVIPVRVLDVEVRIRRVDTGRVDQHVEPLMPLEYRFEQRFERFAGSGVDGNKHGTSTVRLDLCDARLTALFASSRNDHVRAGACQTGRQRAAEHAGSADHDGDLTFETEEFVKVTVCHGQGIRGEIETRCRPLVIFQSSFRELIRVATCSLFGTAALGEPIGMEGAVAVRSLVGMRSEVVSLSLQ